MGLLAALLHVFVALKRTWDISINYTVASVKLTLAISGITLLTFMVIHLFQFRFGATQPFKLCPPPYLVNLGTLFHLRLNLFCRHPGLHDRRGVRHLPHGVRGLQVPGVVPVLHRSGDRLQHAHVPRLAEAVPAPSLDIPKRYHNKAIHVGYVMTAFIALIYISFPVYTHLWPMSPGALSPEAPLA